MPVIPLPDTTWNDLVAYYSQSPECQEYFKSAHGEDLKGIDEEFLKQLHDAFSYQGFDARRIFVKCINNCKNFEAREPDEDLSFEYNIGTVADKFKYNNKMGLGNDFHLLLSVFAQRGCTWDKIEKKAVAGVAKLLNTLKEKYQIDTEVHDPGAALDPGTVTLPRISACFPMITTEIYRLGKGKCLITKQQVGLAPDESDAILCLFFVSMIPKGWVNLDHNIHQLIFLVHVLCDEVMNKKKTGHELTSLENLLVYYRAAYSTPVASEDGRIDYCDSRHLGTKAMNSFKASLLKAADEAPARIRLARPDDPKLEVILAEVAKLKNLN